MPKYSNIVRECPNIGNVGNVGNILKSFGILFLFISSFSSSLIDPDRMMIGMSRDSTEIGTVGPCCRGCGEPAMSHEEFAQRKQSNEIRRIQTVIENR